MTHGNRVARAALAAAVASGAPSTLWALAHRDDPLAATWAAGRMLAPATLPGPRLFAAAVLVHGTLSLGWAVVLAPALPRRRRVTAGALAGLGIAALDLGLAHALPDEPRLRDVARLPLGPQVADHVAFGALVGAAL